MSKNGNAKKDAQLGMSHGKAANQLRKMILFRLMVAAGMDTCFRCGKQIEQIYHLSIEHKEPWLDSDDPVGRFFDWDNVAFSHLVCNVKAATHPGPPRVECGKDGASRYRSGCRCQKCRDAQARRKRNAQRAARPGGLIGPISQ